MAETDQTTESPEQPQAETSLQRGTYEVIRNRLTSGGKRLRERLDKLNTARKDVFGAIETTLLATERVTTSNNCVPRDMTPVGDCFLFGYNVHMGLKAVTNVEDVFAVYRLENHSFVEQPIDLIDDERFRRDFGELFKYYRKTVFVKFSIIGPHLHMAFRISDDVKDIKTFKWLIDGEKLVYIDSRSDHEFRFPPQHDFQWTRTHRDMHTAGEHPHVSIEDRLFVETTEGDLTIKIENNTATGEGIYCEPVDDPDQTLDDAEFFYAIIGSLILLKIRPYREDAFRYFVYCEKTQQALRLDSIEHACVLLPDSHGIIVSNGYFLQTGEYKIFDRTFVDMLFTQRVQSPNGEDYLYVFYNRLSGSYVLLPYNLIEQRVETPISCSGYSFFENGEMIYFKAQDEPQRHHALQIWQTPYVGADVQPAEQVDSLLYKIGNRDIVRGMAECYEVLNLLAKEDSYANLFVDLSKKVSDILDGYYWIGNDEAMNLREDLASIKEAAEAAISEFEKVVAMRRNTAEQLAKVVTRTRGIVSSIHARRFEVINDFVTSLADLRGVRGEIISLRDLRYVDDAQVDALEKEVSEHTARAATRCVDFLLRPEALQPYEKAVVEHRERIDGLKKVADAKKLQELVVGSATELEMLIEIVSNLTIDDATVRITIIDAISAIFSQLNQTRAVLKTKMHDLMKVEGVAEFNSQLKLMNQSVVNYLDICDTAEKCEEYLTKMMIQLEELEGQFAEFDEFVIQLTEKRQEVYNAFETRKLQLIEARNRRATTLASAADRILGGIKARIDNFSEINEINGYFAADLMIEKVRDIVKQLGKIGDTVKVDDIQSRLKTIREDAVRQLKDRKDLYEDGDSVIRLGEHRFSVNNQAFDLTTVHRGGDIYFHLTGTNYFDRIEDPALLDTRDVWSQEVLSENEDTYRGEYLAYQIFRSTGRGGVPEAAALLELADEERLALVQRFMGPRYSEAYVKGVHDHDAAIILEALLRIDATAGLLRYHPRARALASVFWFQFADDSRRELIGAKLRGFGAIKELFPDTNLQKEYVGELQQLIREYTHGGGRFAEELVGQAGEYLFEELTRDVGVVISSRARDLYRDFNAYLSEKHFIDRYRAGIDEVRRDTTATFLLQRDWVTAYLATRGDAEADDFGDEVAALLLADSFDITRVIEAPLSEDLTGMVGNHPLIEAKTYRLNYNTFVLKMERYQQEVVPRFEAYGRLKKELLERERDKMRLDEFRPRVLTSFVRNKLIDQVYLRLLGDNLAKQIGVVGEQKRTDRMGLLLLISPPGYGKTTLMEYLANRLGIVFMKINGPALGHGVTSLDPAAAPNAAAREEMKKLNLAFEMGDNVMIYVDDIQHCNPEFLQKFISLCDAQRKVEGVFRGKTRTYDLRGKKVAVVMAGNPYTESGEKFKIPDMLANRADTYNLGEIIGDSADVFEMSYLENSLTSNSVLNQLASRSQQDVYALIRMAKDESGEGVELEGNYSVAEIDEMVSVMRKLMRVRDVVLRVNEQYIRSAGTSDEYRTEPPFKLQGSYRNMNRIAERVVGVMNDRELDELILSNYQNDAQTLTTGTEPNMLKFKELLGRLTPEETQRWEDIKRTYHRNVQLKGAGEDEKFGQMIVQLTSFSDGLESIKRVIDSGMGRMLEDSEKAADIEPPPLKASFDGDALDAMRQLAGEMKAAFTERQATGDEGTEIAMRGLIDELKAVRAADEAIDPQQIHIISKLPTSFLAILRQQFKLMQGWLKPIYEQTQEQTQQIGDLKRIIHENLGEYETLIKQLEEAADKDEAVFDTLAKHKIRVGKSAKKTKATREPKEK